MRVFISWSGRRSRAVAHVLDEWLQCVIQAIRPWMSDRDIDRGALWFTEITSQLHQTTTGIVCLTRENINRPWILFEAGALAKGLSSARVCTLLVDIEPSQVSDPLAQFNHTRPNREEMFQLVRTLNAQMDLPLPDAIVHQVFEVYWPKFESDFQAALDEFPIEESVPQRSEESILSELLQTTRSLDRKLRGVESKGFLGKKDEQKSFSMYVPRTSYFGPAASGEDAFEKIINLITDLLMQGLADNEIIKRIGPQGPNSHASVQATVEAVRRSYEKNNSILQADD